MRFIDWLPLGAVPEITAAELAGRLAARERLQILDVRTGSEYRAGHIAGAVHVPVHRLATRLATLSLDPHLPVIAVCKTAHRSIPAVRLLARDGYDAAQLAGGLDRWRRLGHPVVRGETS